MVPSAEPNANRKDIPCHGSPPFPEEVPTQEEVDALTAIASAMGGISQLGRVIARSLALTRALLAFEKELARGRFSRAFAEQVDIAVANENGCPVGVLAAGMLVAVVGYVLPLRLWMPDLHESRRLQLKITAVPVAVLIVVQALSVARSPFVRQPWGSGQNALATVVALSFFFGLWFALVNLVPRPRSTEPVESIRLTRSKTSLAVGLIVFLIFVAVLGPGLGPLGDDPRVNSIP